MHVLIIGAGGFIGRHLTGRLVAEGVRVTAAGRAPERLERLIPGVAALRCDLSQDDIGDWRRRLIGVRAAHDSDQNQRWSGRAEVEASRTPLARLLCRMMRLPAPGSDVPVTVTFERHGDRERWCRDFAGRRYESTLSERRGLMVERMGPATNIFHVSVENDALRLDLVGFRFFGIPLPLAFRPHCNASEREQDGRYLFDVPVSLWWLGRIIRYTGRMERYHD